MTDTRPSALVYGDTDDDPQEWADFVRECQDRADSGKGATLTGITTQILDTPIDQWSAKGVDITLERTGHGFTLTVDKGEAQAILWIGGPATCAYGVDVVKDPWQTAEGKG